MPVQGVELVGGHGVDGSFDGRHGEEIARGVQEEAPVWVHGAVHDRHSVYYLKWKAKLLEVGTGLGFSVSYKIYSTFSKSFN